MMVKLITVDLVTGQVIRTTQVNWHNPKSIAWLLKHLLYCFKHKRGVQMLAASDKEPG